MSQSVVQERVSSASKEAPFEERYASLMPEFEAIRVEDLVPVDLDVPLAVATALRALPEILVVLPALAPLPEFDLDRIRRLDEYAMALADAHAAFLKALQPVDSLQPLVEEGSVVRELLLADATALALRGLVDGSRLRQLRGPKGYKNLAFDLQILASIFRRSFAAIQGKCGTTEQEVQSAVRIAAGILRGVGLREQGMTMISAAAELQLRVFTVFTRLYDQARRGVLFLRWDQGDAETIAPSLYAGRERRRVIGSDAPRTDNGGGPSPNQAITRPFIA